MSVYALRKSNLKNILFRFSCHYNIWEIQVVYALSYKKCKCRDLTKSLHLHWFYTITLVL